MNTSPHKIVSSFRTKMADYVNRRIAVVPFIAVWSVYFFLLATAGYTASRSGLKEAIVYQVLFVLAVCAPVLLLAAPRAPVVTSTDSFDRSVIAGSLSIGVIALACLVADRLVVQGIDYSGGACIAREQMTRLGLERQGVSSLLSVVGQLFGYAYFVAVTLVVTRLVPRKTFWLVMGIAFCLMIVQAQVAASRSPLILFASFVFAGICIRIAEGSLPRIKPLDIVLTIVFGLVAAGFVLSVFSCRAAASNQTTAEYAQGFTEFLGAKEAVEHGAESQLGWRKTYWGGLFSIAALYFVHSAYTFAGIISLPADSQILTLDGPIYLLQRVGLHISSSDANPNLSGRFPSLPGTLYHDGGLLAVLIGGLVLGLSLWASSHLVSRYKVNVVMSGVACAVMSIAYTSPLLLATNMMAFPFICFGFLSVPIIAYLGLSASRKYLKKISIPEDQRW
ncbi:hypothetical protein ACVWWK_004095 [Bradyrhizobium sp. LB9.1b]